MVDKETDVHLGYVGRPLDADEQLDIRLSRLGGLIMSLDVLL